MKTMMISLMLASVLVAAVPAQANHDPSDLYTTIQVGAETFYIDDDEPVPFVYLESNGWEGMQRGEDGNSHGHPGHVDPDTLLV